MRHKDINSILILYTFCKTDFLNAVFTLICVPVILLKCTMYFSVYIFLFFGKPTTLGKKTFTVVSLTQTILVHIT